MMLGSYRWPAGVLLLAEMLAGASAYGQGGATGAISGVGVDTSGGSISGADVQVIDARTESIVRKLPTGTEGIFVATLLPPGNYIVVVNKSGFAEAKVTDIEVRVTETTRVTITLNPGAVSEKVEITAQVTSVETSNAFQRRAKRFECGGAAWAWQRETLREWPARRQQQLFDRRNQRHGLQRGASHVCSAAQS